MTHPNEIREAIRELVKERGREGAFTTEDVQRKLDEQRQRTDPTLTIQWGEENDFAGLEGDWRAIPTWAIEERSGIVGLVIMNGLSKLTEPVFIHPITAYELASKGVLNRFAADNLTDEQLLFPYGGWAGIDRLLLQLYVGPA